MANIKKLVALASQHLQPGEQVHASVMGAYETKIMGQDTLRNGVFLATDRRVFFYGKRMFGYNSESFPYSSISSFDAGKGMLGKSLSFFASGNKVTMKWIKTGDFQGFMDKVQSSVGKKSAAPEVAASKDDVADQIKKLADLRDSGILTEEEFSIKKKQLLGI
ncbi:putative oligomerization/nucleic acid binding protein [Paenibacillus sp. BK033]|uniref:PH domain-containing protein n=1 Tax=Paenibacillus sp. BK033 TaxID=2512133 RepID=UPI001053A3CA|nr:PH domain-containing protein [Paenibacillus sp. BK033]TCN00871.1 putative oligomerization/nucleic acid binding protein [Paenibacillus sp. BK033]